MLLVVPAVALLLTGAGLAARPAAADEPPTGIQARGQGLVLARPDVAYLTLGATVRRDNAGDAFARTEELVTALTATLRANGVAEADIQTRQFSLNPEYGRSTGDNPPPVVGWRAVHTVQVKLRDFSRIGATIDQGVQALGAEATIQGISFAIEDTDALAARARREAIANARRNAEEMAAAAGVRVGRVMLIQDVSAPPPTPVRQAFAVAAAAPVPVEIAPGEQSLTITVEVVFAIE